MTLEGTLGRLGIGFRKQELIQEKVERFLDDEYHTFIHFPGVGWVEKRDDGKTFLTKEQLMGLQSRYLGVPKPYVAERQEDGTFLINMRR